MKHMELAKTALLAETKRSVEMEKQSTVVVLEYLAVVDLRQIWLEEGYSSMHDFCVRFLNYSEGEAGRRIQAARLLVKVPQAKGLLEENSISLSGLSLIAPHLTQANASVMLPLVTTKSNRQIVQVLTDHFVLVKRALREVVQKKKRRVLRPVKHTRFVPTALRRQVMQSDGHQCAYRGPSGVVCNQTGNLQIDHIRAWGKGGRSLDASNLRVLCRAHNLLLGRRDFPSSRSNVVLNVMRPCGRAGSLVNPRHSEV